MIFSIEGHIYKIIKGLKTETRRNSDKYEIGKTYAIQPNRTSKGIPDGRILIIGKNLEIRNIHAPISWSGARHEGNYGQIEYEELYNQLNPKWRYRYAYKFKFIPTKGELK